MAYTYFASNGDRRVCTQSCGFIIDDDDEGFLTGWHQVFCTFALGGGVSTINHFAFKREEVTGRANDGGNREEGGERGRRRRETYRHHTKCLNCLGLVSVFSSPGLM